MLRQFTVIQAIAKKKSVNFILLFGIFGISLLESDGIGGVVQVGTLSLISAVSTVRSLS